MRKSMWQGAVGKSTVPRIGAVFLLGALVTLLIGLTFSPNPADADKQSADVSQGGKGKSCQDRLVGNVYSCVFRGIEGNQSTDSLSFFNSSGFFFVDSSIFSGDCQCEAKGSFKNPKFNASNVFVCLDFDGPRILTGKAVGKARIAKGQFLHFSFGNASVFQCDLVFENRTSPF